jgi:hypothetical protein
MSFLQFSKYIYIYKIQLNNIQEKINEEPVMYLVNLRPLIQDIKSKNAFLIFGEHARELITVEIGLNLVKTLCDIKN